MARKPIGPILAIAALALYIGTALAVPPLRVYDGGTGARTPRGARKNLRVPAWNDTATISGCWTFLCNPSGIDSVGFGGAVVISPTMRLWNHEHVDTALIELYPASGQLGNILSVIDTTLSDTLWFIDEAGRQHIGDVASGYGNEYLYVRGPLSSTPAVHFRKTTGGSGDVLEIQVDDDASDNGIEIRTINSVSSAGDFIQYKNFSSTLGKVDGHGNHGIRTGATDLETVDGTGSIDGLDDVSLMVGSGAGDSDMPLLVVNPDFDSDYDNVTEWRTASAEQDSTTITFTTQGTVTIRPQPVNFPDFAVGDSVPLVVRGGSLTWSAATSPTLPNLQEWQDSTASAASWIDGSGNPNAQAFYMQDDDESDALIHQAASATTEYTLTWPAAVSGTAGHVLEDTDGAGTLGWVAQSGGGADLTPTVRIINDVDPDTVLLALELDGSQTGHAITVGDSATTFSYISGGGSTPGSYHGPGAFIDGTGHTATAMTVDASASAATPFSFAIDGDLTWFNSSTGHNRFNTISGSDVATFTYNNLANTALDINSTGIIASLPLNVDEDVFIDGVANEPQLRIQAHSTQDSTMIQVEDNSGLDRFTVGDDGTIKVLQGANTNFQVASSGVATTPNLILKAPGGANALQFNAVSPTQDNAVQFPNVELMEAVVLGVDNTSALFGAAPGNIQNVDTTGVLTDLGPINLTNGTQAGAYFIMGIVTVQTTAVGLPMRLELIWDDGGGSRTEVITTIVNTVSGPVDGRKNLFLGTGDIQWQVVNAPAGIDYDVVIRGILLGS